MTEPLLTSKAEDNDVYDFGGNNVEMEADPFVRKSSRGGGSHYKKQLRRVPGRAWAGAGAGAWQKRRGDTLKLTRLTVSLSTTSSSSGSCGAV